MIDELNVSGHYRKTKLDKKIENDLFIAFRL